jgi:hypothetical protein
MMKRVTGALALCMLVHLFTIIPLRANDMHHSTQDTALCLCCYAFAGLTGGLAGYVGSAFAAIGAAPHKPFPTQQEWLAEGVIYRKYLAEYSSYAVPICCGASLIGVAIVRGACYWRSKAVVSRKAGAQMINSHNNTSMQKPFPLTALHNPMSKPDQEANDTSITIPEQEQEN